MEDEELLLRTLCGSLRQLGCEVTCVGCGQDALKTLGSVVFDICLLDVQLPDGNGLELLKTIQESSPATNVVVMTALELSDEQLADLQRNSVQFLPKPFGLQKVRSLVLGILNREPYAGEKSGYDGRGLT